MKALFSKNGSFIAMFKPVAENNGPDLNLCFFLEKHKVGKQPNEK
jgi:hypothetical protein